MRKLTSILLWVAAALVPQLAAAQFVPPPPPPFLPPGWAVYICQALLTCDVEPAALAARIILGVQITFVGIIFVMGLAISLMLIFGSTNESHITEARSALLHVVTACIIVSLASLFIQAFGPGYTGAHIVNPGVIEIGLVDYVAFFFKAGLGIALIVNIVIQGIRLVLAQGDEEAGKAKKRLIQGFIGVGVVLLAQPIVWTVNPLQGHNTAVINEEIVGIGNFLLTLFGFLAALVVIAAGLLLIVSVDESLKDKAKLMIKTAIITLVVVLASFALLNVLFQVPTA